jgi:hypothetical protein
VSTGIQQYLYENGRLDNIFTDGYYDKFTDNLNEVLQRYEIRLNTQGMSRNLSICNFNCNFAFRKQ